MSLKNSMVLAENPAISPLAGVLDPTAKIESMSPSLFLGGEIELGLELRRRAGPSELDRRCDPDVPSGTNRPALWIGDSAPTTAPLRLLRPTGLGVLRLSELGPKPGAGTTVTRPLGEILSIFQLIIIEIMSIPRPLASAVSPFLLSLKLIGPFISDLRRPKGQVQVASTVPRVVRSNLSADISENLMMSVSLASEKVHRKSSFHTGSLVLLEGVVLNPSLSLTLTATMYR
mmetsp:Transcript_19942/g.31213  ORF Transcript_19942/g.31213 Transcript_19942/m.31213 type:complete len:231 (+) Transcript_19942:385-1077(+)